MNRSLSHLDRDVRLTGQVAKQVSRWQSWGRGRTNPILSHIPCQQKQLNSPRRHYARPVNLNIPPGKIAFKPPPPPPKLIEPSTVEDGHEPGEAQDASGVFDGFLAKTAQVLKIEHVTSVSQLYDQYHERGGRMCGFVVPYDERPPRHRRADVVPEDLDNAGDGLVMVVHALFKPDGKLDKICACSGFVVDAQSTDRSKQEGEVIITCAHTLEEMHRNIRRTEDSENRASFSFIISSSGKTRRVKQVLSSMPRSDTVAIELEMSIDSDMKLRTLPLSPFPVYTGTAVLTHLFGADDTPKVVRSQSRLPPSAREVSNKDETEKPLPWLNDLAWRRWGVGTMLGYRSYTNIEVEAGIHSSLPHILTSILPTPGSSGGPLVNAETGAVVGMISGRRMDNRVEGERGWGASSESIFEMFSLPGFMPTSGSTV